jgi:protein-tyrosine phosphatase
VIDLHTHVLPGLDDGPEDMAAAVALAKLASERGTRTMVATPHVRDDHLFPLETIAERAAELNAKLAEEGVDLEVATGGEVAVSKAAELDDEALASVCLGQGPYLLVESPYTHAPAVLERVVFDLQARGFRPILAHPERSPSFLSDFVRLTRLVEGGVLCSVTALSMAGAFGQTVRGFTARLFAAGLVHNVASDVHDRRRRPPGLGEGFERLDSQLPGLMDQMGWLTVEAPSAILAGEQLPGGPVPLRPARAGWRRLVGRHSG